jgi:MATE family multidrug resistance protein
VTTEFQAPQAAPRTTSELVPTLRLAVPVVLAELGWMAMGVVDTVMVGPLGPAAIGAAGIGTALHMALVVFGMGTLLGLDTLVSQSFGARRIDECHRWLFHGIALALAMTVPLMALCGLFYLAIPALGFHGEVRPLLQSYYGVVLWSTPFLLLYAACRRYLQGVHFAWPVMFALVTANLVNAAANWMLIYGHLGLPALGVAGAAWATAISRVYMLAVLVAAIVWWRRKGTVPFSAAPDQMGTVPFFRHALERWRLARLVGLGFPAASQMAAEFGVFAMATALAGTLDPVSSASHQIAINLAGVTFMVPLGLGSAGAVRVGHAIGAREPARAAAAGWTAIALGAGFMVAMGAVFYLAPAYLIGLFTQDARVLALGSSLLLIAAVFQLFDGIQGVVTGTLRGLGETRAPMVANLAGHWLVGLPVSYLLCFVFGWGAAGLWWGLSVGLILVAVVLIDVWRRRIAALLAASRLAA